MSLEPWVSEWVSKICTTRDAHLKRLHLKMTFSMQCNAVFYVNHKYKVVYCNSMHSAWIILKLHGLKSLLVNQKKIVQARAQAGPQLMLYLWRGLLSLVCSLQFSVMQLCQMQFSSLSRLARQSSSIFQGSLQPYSTQQHFQPVQLILGAATSSQWN